MSKGNNLALKMVASGSIAPFFILISNHYTYSIVTNIMILDTRQTSCSSNGCAARLVIRHSTKIL